MPLSGLSIFGDAWYLDAARPLFSGGEVEAVEWTVDSWSTEECQEEIDGILRSYSDAGKLIGHGIQYPVLAARADRLRAKWLEDLKPTVSPYNYTGVSVHFGFASGGNYVEGAPMPMPLCDEVLDIGRKAMAGLAKTVDCPIGIENLALAFSRRDVDDQGRFIDALLKEVDGYLLLDLHNIHCQAVNFGVPIIDLVKTYPLQRVQEIHVAGGSWSEHGSQRVRRDTHDNRVPDEVFEALPAVIALCPQLRFVMLEKLPQSFNTEADAEGFRDDFLRMKSMVTRAKAAA